MLGRTDDTLSDLSDATRKEFADLRVRVDTMATQIPMMKEIESLKRQITYFKILGAVVVVVASTFGIGSVLDIRRSFDESLRKTTDEATAYYSDLFTGYAHISSENFTAAIPVLERCFQNRQAVGKEYDPSVVAPLLMAYNEVDDWESADKLIQVLENNDARLNGLRDAWVYLNIGSVQVQEALDDPGKLASGMYWLRQARQFVPAGDTDMRRDISIAFWMASLTQKDLQSSRQYIAEAMTDDNPPSWLESWQKLSDSRFFRQLFARFPDLQTSVRAMWTQQVQQRSSALSTVSLRSAPRN